MYTPEELSNIVSMHNEGRLLPFIELPLVGGQWIARFKREGDRYVCALTARDANMFLEGINDASNEVKTV
jgi:hypothetical protein